MLSVTAGQDLDFISHIDLDHGEVPGLSHMHVNHKLLKEYELFNSYGDGSTSPIFTEYQNNLSINKTRNSER